MSLRIRILILAALALVVLGAHLLAPPTPPATGAFGRGPVIALVHGLGSGAGDWLPVGRLLARRHRVVLVDLPGHGMSAMPEPFSLERAVLGLNIALARESNDPMVLVGHSVGGLVVAAEALDHPERVRALVLVETALRPQVAGQDRLDLLEDLQKDYPGLLHQAYSAFGRDSAQGEALYRQVAAMDPAVIKPWIHLAVTTDLSERIASLHCPLLVVLAPRSWSEGESWTVAAAALGYARAPRAQVVRIEDCGHFVMLDQPADLAEAIEHFADSPENPPLALASIR